MEGTPFGTWLGWFFQAHVFCLLLYLTYASFCIPYNLLRDTFKESIKEGT